MKLFDKASTGLLNFVNSAIDSALFEWTHMLCHDLESIQSVFVIEPCDCGVAEELLIRLVRSMITYLVTYLPTYLVITQITEFVLILFNAH